MTRTQGAGAGRVSNEDNLPPPGNTGRGPKETFHISLAEMDQKEGSGHGRCIPTGTDVP